MNFKSFFKHFLESREVINNIKNKNPSEIWKVAQDMRKYPGDYPDLDAASIISHNDSTFNSSDYIIEKGDYYIFKMYPTGPFNKIKKSEAEMIYTDVKTKYGVFNHDNESGTEVVYKFIRAVKDYLRMFNVRIHSLLSKKQVIVRDLDMHKKFKNKNHERIAEYQKSLEEIDKKLKQTRKKIDRYTKLNNEDILTIFKEYNVTAPTIYRYLISNAFSKPKHPSEIQEEYRDLPEDVLYALFYRYKTPQDLAKDSARITNGESEIVDTLKFSQNNGDGTHSVGARVLQNNEKENEPSKKESHDWLKYINDNIVNKLSRKSSPNNIIHFDTDVKHQNFPTWLLGKRLKTVSDSRKSGILNSVADYSFQSWTTFRWFLYNIESKFLVTTKEVHGPAGETHIFFPLNMVSKIVDEDLVNGIKTSPEKAFENSAKRIADEYNKQMGNKEYSYPREYIDTPKVRVLYNKFSLEKEGERMNHCVGGYHTSCMSARSLILKLPNSTAELNPTSLTVYQHMGYGNSKPVEEDVESLSEWIKLNGGSITPNRESTHGEERDDEDFDIDLDFLNDEDE